MKIVHEVHNPEKNKSSIQSLQCNAVFWAECIVANRRLYVTVCKAIYIILFIYLCMYLFIYLLVLFFDAIPFLVE